MRFKAQLKTLILFTLIPACVPLATYHKAEAKNAVLEDQADRDKDKAMDQADQAAVQADKNVSLALQNHELKINNADLRKAAQDRDEFYDSVTRDLRQQVSDGKLRITRNKEMLTLDVADEILFDSAKADLKKDGLEILSFVGKAIVKSDRTVRVVGYTDDQPMLKGSAFATNWELSTARATTVVRFLQEQAGLDPKRLLAAGRGEWMPIANNATAEGRQRNRRITITLIDPNLLDAEESSTPAKAAP